MTQRLRHLAVIVGGAALSACSTLPVEIPESTVPSTASATAWQSAEAVDDSNTVTNTQWWELFGDDQLSRLIETGLGANQDVAIAMARLRQAAADLRSARSTRLPQLDFALNARRAEVSPQGAGAASQLNNAGFLNAVNEFYDLGVTLNWEADLFGRLGAQVSAAQSEVAAAAADAEGMRLTVAATIAATYLQLRALQGQLEVERTNVRISEEQLTLARDLATSGLGAELDALRAEGQLESARARLPALAGQIAGQRFALATLVGEVPEGLEDFSPGPLPTAPAVLPAGVRSDLLRRRPDVQAATWTVRAAASRLEANAKVRFPQLVLTGAGGTDAGTFIKLLEANSVTWLLGAAVAMPVYRGGALRAAIDDAEAALEIAQLELDRTTLVALQEAESALAAYAAARDERERLRRATRATAEAAAIATRLYDTGLGDYLSVLDARREDRVAALALVNAGNRMNQRAVELYRALGGGWESTSASGDLALAGP